MVETSAGKKLSAARLAKGLSIDEAAHETKMRPDKILALENDDYSRFGSHAYAKGFLLIYSRFLGVDVTEQLRDFDGYDNRVNVDDYQYLSNAPQPDPEKSRVPLSRLEKRKPPSIIPLLIFVVLCGIAGLVYWVSVQNERINPKAPAVVKATPTPAPILPAATPVPRAAKAKPATPPPVAQPVQMPNELVVEPLRKTYVTIREGTPDSTPIFEGIVYPNVRPLKKKGTRFFVEVRDESAVRIRKNGQPIAYQPPGISIQ